MRILYLEDNRGKVNEIRKCLRPLGYEILSVDTVDSACALLEQEEFALVMSGIHLEFENAFDLVRFVRRHDRLNGLPILLIDSHQTTMAKAVNESLQSTCATLGVSRYLAMEAFDGAELESALAEILNTGKFIDDGRFAWSNQRNDVIG